MWARIIHLVCGLWLMVAPSVLEVSKHAVNMFYILGPVIVSIGIISMSESVRNFRLMNMVPGACLVLSPMFLDEAFSLKIHHMLIGLITILATLYKGKITHRFGGGWRSLIQRDPVHMHKEI